jgi:hypothetical protein
LCDHEANCRELLGLKTQELWHFGSDLATGLGGSFDTSPVTAVDSVVLTALFVAITYIYTIVVFVEVCTFTIAM